MRGKANDEEGHVTDVEDHPRLCGEKDTPSWRNTSILGSPPPMRGKEKISHRTLGSTGITPAYAGKRSSG